MNHFSRLSGSPRIQPGIRLALLPKPRKSISPSSSREWMKIDAARAALAGARTTWRPSCSSKIAAARSKSAASALSVRNESWSLSCQEPSATHRPSSQRTSSVSSTWFGIGTLDPAQRIRTFAASGMSMPRRQKQGSGIRSDCRMRMIFVQAPLRQFGPELRFCETSWPKRSRRCSQASSPRPGASTVSSHGSPSFQRQTSIMLICRRSRSGTLIRRAMAIASPTSRSSAGLATGSPSSPATKTE